MAEDQAAQAQGQAQAHDRRNKGVFWELGLAIKENDPTDTTGKKDEDSLQMSERQR